MIRGMRWYPRHDIRFDDQDSEAVSLQYMTDEFTLGPTCSARLFYVFVLKIYGHKSLRMWNWSFDRISNESPIAGGRKEGDNHFRRKHSFTRQPLPVLCYKCVCSARRRLHIWFGSKFMALLSSIRNVSKGEFAYKEMRQLWHNWTLNNEWHM
jgi:hypothetical protein